MVAFVNGLIVAVAIVAAVVVAGNREPRRARRKWGWGFRVGHLYFWRR